MLTSRFLACGFSIACLFAVNVVVGKPSSPSEQIAFNAPAEILREHPAACRYPFLPDNKYQCGVFDVPLDYHNLSAGNGQVDYVRLPAAAEGVRKGTIFVYPGLPFSTFSPTWLLMSGDTLHDRMNGEYDIVVWMPRGTGIPLETRTIPGPVACFANATERNGFYAHAAAELGFAAEWDHNLEYRHLQRDEDIAQWYAVQKKVVEHCLESTDISMLSYMGTAASARDLAAMADEFDGPGSPINFWGTGHGSLIGSYLLKNARWQRAGRVILDNPLDPATYSGEDPYRTWRRDIQWANTTLARFAQSCIEDDETGCRMSNQPDPEDVDSDWTAQAVNLAAVITRSAFVGWKQGLGVELMNHEYRSLLTAVYRHDDIDSNPTMLKFKYLKLISGLPRELDYFTLDLMPVFCGDLNLEHNSEVMLARGRKMPGDLISSKRDAPILLQTAFPSLQYMCHLWPVRAVERWSDLATPEHKRPANPVLVLGNDLNPLSDPQYADSVLRFLRGPNNEHHEDADIVLQTQFGVPGIGRGTYVSNVISDYLRNGTMPERHRCYGNGLDDNGRVPEQKTKPTPSDVYLTAQLFHPLCTLTKYPEPLPTGQTTSDGRPILFYVKSTVQYRASEPENLELLEGDIIGVTRMRNDGWVIGESVNEERRQPGRYLLPPTAVCLL
ncbi:hypothetical protein V8D89_008457 [Ganoderma adspersum]